MANEIYCGHCGTLLLRIDKPISIDGPPYGTVVQCHVCGQGRISIMPPIEPPATEGATDGEGTAKL